MLARMLRGLGAKLWKPSSQKAIGKVKTFGKTNFGLHNFTQNTRHNKKCKLILALNFKRNRPLTDRFGGAQHPLDREANNGNCLH